MTGEVKLKQLSRFIPGGVGTEVGSDVKEKRIS